MNDNPGLELKKLRESKGITLEQAARDTCLRTGLLQALEESAEEDLLPSVYRKLSLRMYARYLGLEVEMTRRAARTPEGRMRIAPMGVFLRRMGRPAKPSKIDPAQRNRLLAVAKTTSAAIVVVLAVGLWSLNAKISRLHFEEPAPHTAAVPAETAAENLPAPPVAESLPPDPVKLTLDGPVPVTLVPAHDPACAAAE